MSESKEPTRVFARTASGLTRSVGAYDAMMYNMVNMGVLFVFIYTVWGAGLYPGVHLPTTMLIALPMSIIMGILYVLLSAAMPRSGGDYIWVSRIIHPAIGFTFNFIVCFVLMTFIAVEPGWCLQFSIGPFFQLWGAQSGNTSLVNFGTWLTDPWVVTFLGILYFLALAYIVFRGTRMAFKAQWVMFALIIIGTLLYILSMLFISRETFVTKFNAESGMNYDATINAAKALNPDVVRFTLSATILGVVYSFLNLTGFNFSSYVAGEIKDVRKSQLVAIVGGLVIFCALMMLVYLATYKTMGAPFTGAISYLSVEGDPAYNLSFAEPYPQSMMFYATDNILLLFLVNLGYAVTPLAAGLAYIFLIVRNVFAWSFDRVVPEKLSAIDKKYNSPYVAIIFVVALSIVFQHIWLFTGWLDYITYGITGLMMVVAVTGIAGVLFPIRRKDIFDAAPEMVKKKWMGVPIVQIFGFLTFLFATIIIIFTLLPAYGGAIQWNFLIFLLVLILLGIIVYYISSFYRRSKIPLELSFKEIPPE